MSTAPPTRRRPTGPSLGPVPLACVVVVELGFVVAVVLVAADHDLLPVAGLVLALAVLVGLLRWRDRWLVAWAGLALRFRARPRAHGTDGAGEPEDARLRALRVLVGDLVLARRADHDGRDVGLVGHDGAWSAVLAPEATAAPDGEALLAATSAQAGPDPRSFPLGALAGELSDRGVVLDAISALWHCRPGGADLPGDAAATDAYRELLGPLPCLSRRDAWLVVRLDPARCPAAVAERGGATVGAHRALLGAVARIRRVLDDHGVPVRPLGPDEVLRAAADAAVLGPGTGRPDAMGSREHWGEVVVGSTGHATFGVTAWPGRPEAALLDPLTGTGVTGTTLAVTLEPVGDGDGVGLRGAIRLTARDPDELDRAGQELRALAAGLGMRIDPLDGQQAAGLAATLPLGTAP